jgi:hypothetical protein
MTIPHRTAARSAPTAIALALAALASTTAVPAHATPKADAAKLSRAATRLLVLKKLPEACDLYQQSYELEPLVATLASLAKCREQAGQIPAAVDAYRKLVATKHPVYQKQAEAALKQLEPRLPPPAPAPVKAPEPPPPPVVVPVAPVKSVAGAAWNDGFGFVVQGAPPPPAGAPPAPPKVPAKSEEHLTRVAVSLDAGLAIFSPVVYQCAAQPCTTRETFYAPRLDFTVRTEFRRASSWIAPWFDMPSTGVVVPSDGNQLWAIASTAPHFGLDLHPGRLPNLGFGPFFGWRFGLMIPKDGSPVFDQGAEVSPINIHIRTAEAENKPPAFDLDMYFVQRFAQRGFQASFAGARMGVGGQTRFRLVVEGRLHASGEYSHADGSFDVLAASFPQILFLGIGIGSAE